MEVNVLKNGAERVVAADRPVTVSQYEEDGVPAEVAASDQDEENSESVKATEEAPAGGAAASEPEEESGNTSTGEDSGAKTDEQPTSQDDSVVFEINGDDDDDDDADDDKDGPPRLHLETPEGEPTSPTQEEEEEEEEPTAAPADQEDIRYEECARLLQELREGRGEALRHSSRLHAGLAGYFRRRAGEDGQPERGLPERGLPERGLPGPEQLQEYEKHARALGDLKRRLTADSGTAQQQAEELSSQAQQKLDEVENEWRAFVALKQDVAVAVLSRRLGKQAAQAKVESTLAAEQLRQDELIRLRLKHIKLKIEIHRLEAELRDEEERARDPLQLQFEQLQAERLELRRRTEKQNEESLKTQKKISSSLEVLSNVKEKLFWSEAEVQAKREQLAEVEAAVARKRDLLTRTKQARNGLQRDNLRLKECRELLGNRVLLRDFEDTVDASDHLEEQLENLKGRRAEIDFNCGRWKKNLETT